MAEVIGLAASIFTLVGVVGKVGQGMWLLRENYHNAPTEIHNVLAELDSIQNILQRICAIVSKSNQSEQDLKATKKLFDEPIAQCMKATKQLTTILDSWNWKDSVQSRTRWIFIQRKVIKIIEQLQSHKASFNLLLVILMRYGHSCMPSKYQYVFAKLMLLLQHAV